MGILLELQGIRIWLQVTFPQFFKFLLQKDLFSPTDPKAFSHLWNLPSLYRLNWAAFYTTTKQNKPMGFFLPFQWFTYKQAVFLKDRKGVMRWCLYSQCMCSELEYSHNSWLKTHQPKTIKCLTSPFRIIG